MVDTKELCGADTGRGLNQTTASGKPFWVGDPRPEDVRIEDIAAQLSRICRFGGALKDGYYEDWNMGIDAGTWVHFETYSVAQHCVLVSRNVPPEYALEGLLHDAAEAYIGDMIKPIKSQLTPSEEAIRHIVEMYVKPFYSEKALASILKVVPDYKRMEKRVDAAIRARFGLPAEESEFIKVADYRAVLTEHRDLQNHDGTDWGTAKLPPFDEQIIPVLPSVARQMFLDRFNELYKGE